MKNANANQIYYADATASSIFSACTPLEEDEDEPQLDFMLADSDENRIVGGLNSLMIALPR